jgi:hypothetical protein
MVSRANTGRSYVFLLVILAILIVGVVVFIDPFKWLAQDSQQAEDDQVVFCDFSASDISSITINQPKEDEFALVYQAEAWYLAKDDKEYPASSDKIDRLLEELPGLYALDLASEKIEKHPTFEVDELTGIEVKVYTTGSKPATELIIGKAAPGYQNAFVRFAGKNEVYRSSRNIKSLVGFSFRDYRTKQPWTFEPTTATSITVRNPAGAGEALVFNRADDLWKTADGANANQNELTTLVQKLSELRVNDFIDDAAERETGLEGAETHLVVEAPEGTFNLTVGGKDEELYFVMDQNDLVYHLSKYNMKFFLEDLKFDELTFDDTQSEAVQPDEGVNGGLPSDADE